MRVVVWLSCRFAPKDKTLSSELIASVGEATPLNQKMKSAPTLVVPELYSNPTRFTVCACVPCGAEAEGPIGEWAKPEFDQGAKQAVTAEVVPATLFMLLNAKLFKEEELSAIQCGIVAALRSRNDAGEARAAPISWFVRWWGYEGTRVQKYLAENSPCHGCIINTTGLKPPSKNARYAEPCGFSRYCVPCENILSHMSASFPIHLAAEGVLAMLSRTVPCWLGEAQADSISWRPTDDRKKLHQCGDSCPMLRR